MSQINSESEIEEAIKLLERFVLSFGGQGTFPTMGSVLQSIQVILDDLQNKGLSPGPKPTLHKASGVITANKKTADLVNNLLAHHQNAIKIKKLKDSLEEKSASSPITKRLKI